MSACLLLAGKPLALASGLFMLGWTHSVEKSAWLELWQVQGPELVLMEARVRGSGAGMEPGEGAVLVDGWWRWSPATRLLSLTLAASGATGQGWRLCADGRCRTLAARAGKPVHLRPCPAAPAR